MKFAIIASKQDLAGLNIKESLLDLFEFKQTSEKFDKKPVFQLNENVKLYTAEKKSIYCEDIDKQIDTDLFIFATKHQSKAGIASLSVHTQGNWSKAEYGGRDRQVCVSPANFLKQAMIKLNELGQHTDFEIIQECTHHGPYLEKPSMFVEIGSNEEQWQNKEAAKIIAKTIHCLITTQPPKYKTAVGIGGLHHTPNFKKIILNSDIAMGHVCPKYMLEFLDKELIEQAIERTQPKAELIILDWKGLKEFKRRVKSMIEKTGIEVKRTKDF